MITKEAKIICMINKFTNNQKLIMTFSDIDYRTQIKHGLDTIRYLLNKKTIL